jgi:MFS family permease
MNNLVASHIPPGAKSRALGMAFSGFHSGQGGTLCLCPAVVEHILSHLGKHTHPCRMVASYPPMLELWLCAALAALLFFSPALAAVCCPGCCDAGNLVGLILSPIILLQFGWRALFYSFGLVGLPLVAYWLATVPSKPLQQQEQQQQQQQAAPSSSEGGSGGSSRVSIWRLMSHPATWAIILVNFVNHWGYFIYLNWMPSYFVKVCKGDKCADSIVIAVVLLVFPLLLYASICPCSLDVVAVCLYCLTCPPLAPLHPTHPCCGIHRR